MPSYIFDGNDVLSVNTAVVTTYPFTIAAWFEADNITANHCVVSLGDTASFTEYFSLYAQGTAIGDPTAAISRNAATTVTAQSTTGYSADTWTSATAVYNSATDRRVFINGGSKGTVATNVTPTSIDKLGVGCLSRQTNGDFLSGHIGYVFIWNITLSDAEVSSWHGGTFVQSGSCVGAYDLTVDWGAGPVTDKVGTNNLTISGAAYDASEGPPVSYAFAASTASIFYVRA